MQTDLKKRLPFILKNEARRPPRIETLTSAPLNIWRYFANNNMKDSNSPEYCARSVPQATPAKPRGVLRVNKRLATILTIFTKTSIAIGLTVSCIPMNQPLNTNMESVAGAAHILMLKYVSASSFT